MDTLEQVHHYWEGGWHIEPETTYLGQEAYLSDWIEKEAKELTAIQEAAERESTESAARYRLSRRSNLKETQ